MARGNRRSARRSGYRWGAASGDTKTKVETVAGPTSTVSAAPVTVTADPETQTVTVTKAVTRTATVTARPPAAPKPASGDGQHATLDVTGGGSTANSITWSVDGSISQATGESIPWTKLVEPGSILQVSPHDEDGTSITCEIDGPDGDVLDKQTSTGQYAIASRISA